MNPIRSMTGYAAHSQETPQGVLMLELRGVNSRFLDLGFRMGDEFRPLEIALRERIAARVNRGKLECRIAFTPRTANAQPADINADALQRLLGLAAAISAASQEAPPLTQAEILRWPGIIQESVPDMDALHTEALRLADALIADFNASRAREGDKLAALIRDRLAAIQNIARELRPRVPQIVNSYRERLAARIAELGSPADPERLVQETILFAQKIDVDEELDRLLAHAAEIERILQKGGTAGKRLDFLMQELNREANTLGSKAAAIDLSRASVDLKVLIEQMREQTQNLE
jgi:uncharacterized protein (TIGR00255 family)